MVALEDTWRNLQKIIQERDEDLRRELARQEQNDQLRQEFASAANSFHAWLQVSIHFQVLFLFSLFTILLSMTFILSFESQFFSQLLKVQTLSFFFPPCSLCVTR